MVNNNLYGLSQNGYMMELLDKTIFSGLVHYERERSERTNNPFSLICVDLSKIKERTNNQYPKEIVEIIIPLIRTIDRVGWIKDSTLGVLLPDTSIRGAKIVAEKLKGKLKVSLGDNASPIDFVICSYPEVPDSVDSNTEPNKEKTGDSLEKTHLKMEYSSIHQMSDIITFDSTLIFDIEKTDIHYNWQLIVKRFIDIVGALVGIVLFSPLMLIISVAIRLTSDGTVLFRQERLGYQGKKFTFLKFRTMYADNDQSIHREYVEKLIQGNQEDINNSTNDRPYYKIKHDPRVTPLGRILRKSSLDELPQFFNVLMGHMSLVGPRPPIQYELDNYQNWHRKRILDVKPGITGLWQVKGRSQTVFDEMVRLDLQYAKNWNLWLDFKILFSTVKAVFSGKGAD